MSYQIATMYAVSVLFVVVGAGLLLALLRPAGPGKVYAFRMVGIMALAVGVVLFCSATAMWQWSAEA
jgi:ABC-type lipopolysaccharide export system ATPase subunit